MSVHLIKLAVGVESLPHLSEIQKKRLEHALEEEGHPVLRHRTRHAPRRASELLDGGSIFWVIKGLIRARQKIIGVEKDRDENGRKACSLILDPCLVAIRPRAQRPFQGWRYLPWESAPLDQDSRTEIDLLPPGLARELLELGLL
jgi:hypothetical protein